MVQYTRWRIEWLRQEVARNYTVMYKGIPRELLSKNTPMEIFNGYFPGEVVDAQIGLKVDGLRKLNRKWERNQKKLRFAEAALAEHGTRTTKRTKPLIGTKMDAIEYYQQELDKIGHQMDAQRGNRTLPQSQVGFVTFRSIPLASQRSQLVMDKEADKMAACHAPDPVIILNLSLLF